MAGRDARPNSTEARYGGGGPPYPAIFIKIRAKTGKARDLPAGKDLITLLRGPDTHQQRYGEMPENLGQGEGGGWPAW